MNRTISLRARLTLIILLPLLSVAVIAGLWQLRNARITAADVFDRSLLSAALAVANDVAISGGDALSLRTRDILASTSGGVVYYHVYAPDGVIVAGYATPPVGVPRIEAEARAPTYFEAIYLGRDISGVRMQNRTEIDGLAGIYTTTVWQENTVRSAFVRDLVLRSFIVISSLVAALGGIVWFGVRRGLRPLMDLEDAIACRSGSDLSLIRRRVPEEVEGIVATLNRLFGQVSTTMGAQSEFIANAAHQLRNPIAGVMALAEAVGSAKTENQMRERAADLLDATKKTADLSQQLLLLERADALTRAERFEPLDLGAALETWCADHEAYAARTVTLSLEVPPEPLIVSADQVMLREAIVTLLDNTLSHGGKALSKIDVQLHQQGEMAQITLTDNGRGIAPQDIARAMTRFIQLSDTGKTGLGLSIAKAIVQGHGGALSLHSANETPAAAQGYGLRVDIRLPLVGQALTTAFGKSGSP